MPQPPSLVGEGFTTILASGGGSGSDAPTFHRQTHQAQQCGSSPERSGSEDGTRSPRDDSSSSAPRPKASFALPKRRGRLAGSRKGARGYRGDGGARRSRRSGFLHEPAEVHDGHAGRNVTGNAQVVGDDQHAGAELRLESVEEVQHLPPHRDVEPGGGLIGDDELRRERKRARYPDAARLTAAQLVGITFGDSERQARGASQRRRPRRRGSSRYLRSSQSRDARQP